MKKSALLKSSIREIIHSPARFLSILGIIFLGVAFFVGIGATGPDMLKSADEYYKKQRLADLTVYSSLGFSEKDREYLLDQSGIDRADGQYMTDMYLSEKNEVVRLFSFNEKALNLPKVVAGRLPETDNEIVLDSVAQDRYKLGETFEISESDDETEQLAEHHFEIVGFVTAPEFIDNSKRGNTTIGSGSIDYFALLPESVFSGEDFARLLISFQDLSQEVAYSQEYEDKINKNQDSLEERLEPRSQERLNEIKDKANKEIDENQKLIADGEEELAKAESELKKAKEELDQAEQELADGKAAFESSISSAKAEIKSNEERLAASEQELEVQEARLTEGQRELDRQTGALEANEAQLDQLVSQREQVNFLLDQLASAQDTYDDLVVLAKELETVSDEEIAPVLEQITNNLRLLLVQLPNDDLKDQIEGLLYQITPENIQGVIQGIYLLGEVIQTQRQVAQDNLSQLETGIAAIQSGRQQIGGAQQELDAGRRQLLDGKKQIVDGKIQLADAKQTLALEEERGRRELADAEEAFQAGKAEYESGLATFTEQKDEEMPKLLEAKEELAEAKKEIDELEPASYTLMDRTSNPGYAEYQENADRISSIATVFPTIFFLIAALVSLTTMGRMIEEKRVEIGTLKALGYKNHEIAQKFLIYSLSAGLIGSLMGLTLGFYLFPQIIISAYGQLYNITEFTTPWYLNYSMIGILVALICTVGVALIALRVDLFSTPAALLRPKAPKAGKRIWLEYLTPIWKRISFIQKVTMRNLFRYKARMLMTIFGIAGCTAMILTGFGLRDSIGDIVPIQFSKIWSYEGIVTFNEDASEEEYQSYSETVENLPTYEQRLAMSSETFTIEQAGKAGQDVVVYVPEQLDHLTDFVLFNNRHTGERYELSDDGAIINEKLASLFDLEIGDSLILQNADNQSFEVNITAIVENYVGHFAYLTPTVFEQTFDQTPEYNTELILFNDELSKEQEQEIGEALMSEDNVINVSFLSDSSTALDETTGTLTIVVWVLIISAGLLALIVLYNLNNINISERIRELSTIKVLGFYDKEVTMYIYRENIFLTIIGIAVGLAGGLLVHRFVLQTVELDMLMFSPTVHLTSYLYASLITVFFTIVVGIVMYFKLKNVDMIEALKSNE